MNKLLTKTASMLTNVVIITLTSKIIYEEIPTDVKIKVKRKSKEICRNIKGMMKTKKKVA